MKQVRYSDDTYSRDVEDDEPTAPVDTVRVIEIIETKLLRRGDGDNTPIRVITQYWTMGGKLLCEFDPVRDDLPEGAE